MEYVYVAGASDVRAENIALTQSVSRQTDNYLYSFVDGMNRENAGCESMTNVVNNMQDCGSHFDNGNLFVDSGGYSIIKGAIEPENIGFTIDLWSYGGEHFRNNFDYLFSLDIPLILDNNQFNTKANIYKYNKDSLLEMVILFDKYPELREKIFFVWQFKMLPQYEIWKTLYKELELERYIQNRAIGGMVGLRGVTGIKFSPFIGMVFRCLYDYISANNYSNDFRLHFLGMYNQYDRFEIALMEKLCSYYLCDKNITAKFTYDSVNFAHTARMNPEIPIYCIDGDNIVVYDNVINVPADVIKKVYEDGDSELYKNIQQEIECRRHGERLENASSFSPLNIHSNMNLDRYFERLIDKYALVDLIVKSKSITNVTIRLESILKELGSKMPWLFTDNIKKSIINNFEITYDFNTWFTEQRESSQLDYLIKDFINLIGFENMIS
ncbi:MAG: hypothetical protein AB7U45_04150 [Desulfamplus sp.]